MDSKENICFAQNLRVKRASEIIYTSPLIVFIETDAQRKLMETNNEFTKIIKKTSRRHLSSILDKKAIKHVPDLNKGQV